MSAIARPVVTLRRVDLEQRLGTQAVIECTHDGRATHYRARLRDRVAVVEVRDSERPGRLEWWFETEARIVRKLLDSLWDGPNQG